MRNDVAAVVQVVQVQQEDGEAVSPWLPWWEELHPGQADPARAAWGRPQPLPCAVSQPGEKVFIKHTFDGFHETGLGAWLEQSGVSTLVVLGLITRACVLNTVMSAFNRG